MRRRLEGFRDVDNVGGGWGKDDKLANVKKYWDELVKEGEIVRERKKNWMGLSLQDYGKDYRVRGKRR